MLTKNWDFWTLLALLKCGSDTNLTRHQVSERTIGKYMRELGLRSCVAKQFRVNTTDSKHDLPIAPNLLN
ncbi:hypothetical protein D3C73_868460 [compost metagenome]